MTLSSGQQARHERPLSGTRKMALALSGIAIAGVCYLFSILSIIFLLLLIGGELIYLLGAARVGAAGAVTPLLRRHVPLLTMFLRSFWRRKYAEYRLVIGESEAPRLFAAIGQLARRFEIDPPKEISIEMDANAWVRLRGFRQGAGRTILAVGYDLLAGLSENEVQAVLAHEMGHARFVRRGVKHWLDIGIGQVASVTSQLSSQVDAYRSARKRFYVAELLLSPADSLTRMAARVLASYSRQDEFEADRVAAELFGAACMSSALIKLRRLHEKLGRLPWTERVAQVEVQESFSRWLSRQLSVSPEELAKPLEDEAYDPYLTHPSLKDRVAALPEDDGRRPNDTPGIHFLSDPDRVASRLIAEIHRLAADMEQKDTKALARWTRKTRRGMRMRPAQWPGLVIMIAGILLSIAYMYPESMGTAAFLFISGIVAGALVWRWGRYQDAIRLPVPRFAEIKNGWQRDRPTDLDEREKQIQKELSERIAQERRKKRKLALLTEEGVKALSQCDYLRAFVASRCAIDLDRWKIEGALIHMTATAGLGLWDHIGENLEFIKQNTGLDTPSTRWGAAWTLFLAGDWATSESLLLKALEKEPKNSTLLCLLAIAQSQRGKLQSAILSATKAADLEPQESEQTKLLARLLLDSGRITEADSRLRVIAAHADSDAEIAMLMVRVNLMRHQLDDAKAAADRMRQLDSSAPWLLQLGGAFEASRYDCEAAQFYEDTLKLGHYPEALLCLARIAANGKKTHEARAHLIAALDLDKTVGPKGRGAVELFQPIVSQLTLLHEPRERCVAWIASFPPGASPAALANQSLMLYATSQRGAQEHLDVVLRAMQPAGKRVKAAELQWREAPRDQQPARPVREGIQFVL